MKQNKQTNCDLCGIQIRLPHHLPFFMEIMICGKCHDDILESAIQNVQTQAAKKIYLSNDTVLVRQEKFDKLFKAKGEEYLS